MGADGKEPRGSDGPSRPVRDGTGVTGPPPRRPPPRTCPNAARNDAHRAAAPCLDAPPRGGLRPVAGADHRDLRLSPPGSPAGADGAEHLLRPLPAMSGRNGAPPPVLGGPAPTRSRRAGRNPVDRPEGTRQTGPPGHPRPRPRPAPPPPG